MYRILIVEDDPGIASAVAEQAKMWGLNVCCVVDFRNVMAAFAEYDPHLVLLDISLPFLMVITGAVRFERFPKSTFFLFLQHRTI